MDTEAGVYDGPSSFRPMVREEDLTDQQLDELFQHYRPTCLPRRSEPAAPVVQATTVLAITYGQDGCPQFSDGSHNVIAAEDEAYPDDSDSEIDIGADDAYPNGGIGAEPACGVAIAKLPEAVAGAATREEECAVCMEAFREGQVLRMPCPSSHRFHESCIFRWLAVSRVCPVCRFVLPPAKEETDEESDTDTEAEEAVTGSDAEAEEDDSDETLMQVSHFASETDSSTEAEETDTGSEAEAESTETNTLSDGETGRDKTQSETGTYPCNCKGCHQCFFQS